MYMLANRNRRVQKLASVEHDQRHSGLVHPRMEAMRLVPATAKAALSTAAVPYLCSERLAVKVQPNSTPGRIEWHVHHLRNSRLDRADQMDRIVSHTFHAPRTTPTPPHTRQ